MAKASAEPANDETSQPAADPPATPSDEEAQAAAPEVADEEVEAEKPVEEAVDPETSKRLAAVQKQEKRFREQMASEKAKFDAQVKAFEKERDEMRATLDEFKSSAARVKYDPASVLTKLGMTEEDFETAARHLFARSKAGQADPKWKQASEVAMKEKEQTEKFSALESRLEKLQAQIAEKEHASKLDSAKGELFSLATKAASDEAPLFKALSAKSPAKAREALWATATQLFEETGEPPDPSDVIAAWEKQRRADLDEWGIEAPTVAAKNNNESTTTKPSRTLSAAGGVTAPKQAVQKSPKDERDEILRELNKLKPAND